MILLSLFSGCVLLLFAQSTLFVDSYTFHNYGKDTLLFKASSRRNMARDEPARSPDSGYEDKKKVGHYAMRKSANCDSIRTSNSIACYLLPGKRSTATKIY